MALTDDVIEDSKIAQMVLVGLQSDGTPTKVLCDSSGKLITSFTLQDADSDTKIQVEEGTDDDVVRIDAGGVEVAQFKAAVIVFNEGGADVDFRVEGDNAANLFKTDAGADKVTITGDADDDVVFAVTTNSKDLLQLTGTEAVFNDGSADVDLRVESNNNATMLTVDAGKDVVGIGVASPDTNAALDVEGSIALDEISAPTATADRGKVWTQTDNNLYFQDGAGTNAVVLKGGKHSIWVPAEAISPRDNAGCAELATTAAATNGRPDIRALGFDTSSDEHAQFTIAMPKMWNEGTVTAVFYWTAASGSGTVQWAIQGVALSEGDAIDTAYGTAVLPAVDTLTTAKDVHISATTGAVTIGGTPAAEDLTSFQVYRDVSGDNLGVDALLLGVKLLYTVDSGNDA